MQRTRSPECCKKKRANVTHLHALDDGSLNIPRRDHLLDALRRSAGSRDRRGLFRARRTRRDVSLRLGAVRIDKMIEGRSRLVRRASDKVPHLGLREILTEDAELRHRRRARWPGRRIPACQIRESRVLQPWRPAPSLTDDGGAT